MHRIGRHLAKVDESIPSASENLQESSGNWNPPRSEVRTVFSAMRGTPIVDVD